MLPLRDRPELRNITDLQQSDVSAQVHPNTLRTLDCIHDRQLGRAAATASGIQDQDDE